MKLSMERRGWEQEMRGKRVSQMGWGTPSCLWGLHGRKLVEGQLEGGVDWPVD